MDEVRNMGFQRCPHMILYHFNFGFPLLSEGTIFNFTDTSVQARESENSISGYQEWQAPDPTYQERVYYHHLHGESEVQIVNKHFPLHDGEAEVQATLRWSSDTLPKLIQWKMPGAGTHVLGIEPANCHVGGRHKEREQGTLVFLEPGETVKYNLRLILK